MSDFIEITYTEDQVNELVYTLESVLNTPNDTDIRGKAIKLIKSYSYGEEKDNELRKLYNE